MNIFLIKIDRVAAWTLLFSLITYFITGYGMTKGLIPSEIAITLHNSFLPVVTMIAFVVHTFYAIRLAFMRWKIWSAFGKPLLIIVYILLVVGFIYVGYFFEKNDKIAKQQTTSNTSINKSTVEKGADSVTQGAEKVFTREELAKYNGQNGQPAYVAVDGVVYDLTKVFHSGSHYSHLAGRDLTTAFNSEHALGQITKYPVVGKYQ